MVTERVNKAAVTFAMLSNLKQLVMLRDGRHTGKTLIIEYVR